MRFHRLFYFIDYLPKSPLNAAVLRSRGCMLRMRYEEGGHLIHLEAHDHTPPSGITIITTHPIKTSIFDIKPTKCGRLRSQLTADPANRGRAVGVHRFSWAAGSETISLPHCDPRVAHGKSNQCGRICENGNLTLCNDCRLLVVKCSEDDYDIMRAPTASTARVVLLPCVPYGLRCHLPQKVHLNQKVYDLRMKSESVSPERRGTGAVRWIPSRVMPICQIAHH
jgi:hypothetical protein